jgi:short subunit dehydrogenase-like uncharacterized protein
MPDAFIIYGANGYTGELIAREAIARGLKPILAGRNQPALEKLARELSCPSRIFSLDKPEEAARHLHDVRAVLHCAGPFSVTARPMMEACLKARVNYLDITGEIDVIETAAALDPQAREAGVALLPAVGFDVVPTDCLAAILAAQLPSATHLILAFTGDGGVSPGTAKTVVESLPYGARARIDGRIVKVPTLWKTREVPFRTGKRMAASIGWGDVASAFYSTGIPNIETYMSMPRAQIRRLRFIRPFLPLLRFGFIQRFLQRRIERGVRGPSAADLASSRASIWGQVRDDQGHKVEATLETPGGYQLTILSALACLERTLAGQAPAGFSTPSKAFGKDLILRIPGVELVPDFGLRIAT